MIFLIVLAGILFLLTYPKVYVVRDQAGGTLYWNANEALLFMGGGSSGAHMSYLRYAMEPLLVSMGDVRSPDDGRCSQILVIQITDNDVRRYNTDVDCVAAYDVFEGRIYAVQGPRIWKWSATHFEPATPEEVRAFDVGKVAATTASSPHPWQFDNVEGWSMRKFGQTIPKYQLVLNDQPVTIQFSGETWPQQPISVDLIRPSKGSQRIWSLDERPHRISKTEYENVFGNH